MRSRSRWVSCAAALLGAACVLAPTASAADSGFTWVDGPDGEPGPFRGTRPAPQPQMQARWGPAFSGTQDTAVIRCTFNGGSAAEPTKTTAYYEELFGAGGFANTGTFPRTMRAYFAEASYGTISYVPTVSASSQQIQSEATYGMPLTPNNPSQTSLDSIANDCIAAHEAAINYSGMEGVVVIVPTTGLGASGVGGRRTLTLEGANREISIVWIPTDPAGGENRIEPRGLYAHEIGHTFNLPHVTNGKPQPNGSLQDEVTGYWDPMGFPVGYCFFNPGAADPNFGCDPALYSGAFRSSDFLNWIPGGRTLDVAASGEIPDPPPNNPGGGGPGGSTAPGSPGTGATKAKCKKKAKKGVRAAKKKGCKKAKKGVTYGVSRAGYPTTTVTVEQSAQPPANGNPIFVRVRRTHPQSFCNDYFGVEVRNQVGQFDGELGASGVMISHVRPGMCPALGGGFAAWPVYFDASSGPGAPNGGDPNLADPNTAYVAGETFTSADGLVTIEVLSDTGTGYQVRITDRQSP